LAVEILFPKTVQIGKQFSVGVRVSNVSKKMYYIAAAPWLKVTKYALLSQSGPDAGTDGGGGDVSFGSYTHPELYCSQVVWLGLPPGNSIVLPGQLGGIQARAGAADVLVALELVLSDTGRCQDFFIEKPGEMTRTTFVR
jgi:hypothetical protein